MNNGYGYWPLAILSVVAASWFLYRYVAPKSWRDWSRAGIVQAFIVALYAEMYGFPVTLYLLTRVFRIDVPWLHLREPLWAALLGLNPAAAQAEMMIGMIIGYAFVFLGVGMLIGGWREVYRASREDRLATGGLYGVVRHPQYMGIFVALFGEGVVHWPTVLSLALFPVIVWMYVRLARKEEAEMVKRFGEEYREYQRGVPMFIPRWGDWRQLFRAVEAPAGEQQERNQDAA